MNSKVLLRFGLLSFGLILGLTVFGCASNTNKNELASAEREAGEGDASIEVSSSLEDYIIARGAVGNITYSIANYEPMETWFVSQARGKRYEEIEALYEQLPLIRDTDKFKEDIPPDQKKMRLEHITAPIINNHDDYVRAKKILQKVAVSSMEKTSEFFKNSDLGKKMDIILVINPFFKNGGMGIVNTLADGSKQGRLEVGVAIMADQLNDEQRTLVFLAHELTHIVHQYFGAGDMEDLDYTAPGITVDIGLFSEGLASYLSGLIGETEENGKIFLQQEYRQPGPIDGEDFVQTVAAKYAEDMAGQPFGEEYRLWASGFTNPEERPFPEYPAIMYYLGYHAVKYLHEVENFTITSLLETPLTRMQEPVRRAVRELAQG